MIGSRIASALHFNSMIRMVPSLFSNEIVLTTTAERLPIYTTFRRKNRIPFDIL